LVWQSWQYSWKDPWRWWIASQGQAPGPPIEIENVRQECQFNPPREMHGTVAGHHQSQKHTKGGVPQEDNGTQAEQPQGGSSWRTAAEEMAVCL
jgi:hypothetical protein